MGLAAEMLPPAIAGGMAVCFSHPLELTKTRLQLDQERAMRGSPRMYSGFIDCVIKNWHADGVRGLQRGLGLGITREFCFNAVRIGLYTPILGLVHGAASSGAPTARERMGTGFLCGALGGCCVKCPPPARPRLHRPAPG